MDIQKTTLNMEGYVGTFFAQARIESALPLPQGKSALRVLSTQAEVSVSDANCQNGGVDVAGTITLHLVVEGEDKDLFAFDATADYTHRIKEAELLSSMQAHVTAQLFSCRCQADEGGLRLIATVTLTAVVLQTQNVTAIAALSGERNLQQRQGELTQQRRLLLGAHGFRLREEVKIPENYTLLTAQGVAVPGEVEPTNEGTAVSGTLLLTVLLLGGDGGLKQHNASLAFSDIVPSELAYERTAAITLTQLSVRLLDLEESVLEVDATLSISVYGKQSTTTMLLQDAYDSEGSFAVQKQNRECMQYSCTYQKSLSQSEQLTVPNHLPEAYLPLYGVAQAAITAVHREEEGISVDGVLQLTAVYQCDGGLVHSFTEELPLSFNLEQRCDLIVPTLSVHSVKLSGSGRLLEAQISLVMSGDCYVRSDVCFVDDLLYSEPTEGKRGILLYFADRNETLFDVGKRFGVPISEIQQCNPNIKEPLNDGDRIVLIR